MIADSTASPPKLLILGGPDSGKTTYRTQLYQRIEHQPGVLKLVKSVGDLTAIEEDVKLLVQGLQPRHTSLNTYHSTTFTLADRSGLRFMLEFADYDGEQVGRMASSNHISNQWIERARAADSWLFFLRIDKLRLERSFMTDPVAAGLRAEAPAELTAPSASSEVSAIETLQRLLFVRSASLRQQLRTPRLAVCLSCWDELHPTERELAPNVLLENRAPLFSRFLKATWQPENLRIWGLSSTEKCLPETDGDKEFARKGPEHFGYVTFWPHENERDLTIPVAWLLKQR